MNIRLLACDCVKGLRMTTKGITGNPVYARAKDLPVGEWLRVKPQTAEEKQKMSNFLMTCEYNINPQARVYPGRKPPFLARAIIFVLKKLDNRKNKEILGKLAKGDYNKLPITFTEASTVKDAVKFGKKNKLYVRTLGVKNTSEDLERLNTVNEALTQIHNKTGGRSIMPFEIEFRDQIISADGYRAYASYSGLGDTLAISRELPLDKSSVFHEIGHANHKLYVPMKSVMRPAEIAEYGGSDNLTKNFLRNSGLQKDIEAYIGLYARVSPAEFVAERFAAAMEGKPVSSTIDDAYKRLKGPDIINL